MLEALTLAAGIMGGGGNLEGGVWVRWTLEGCGMSSAAWPPCDKEPLLFPSLAFVRPPCTGPLRSSKQTIDECAHEQVRERGLSMGRFFVLMGWWRQELTHGELSEALTQACH